MNAINGNSGMPWIYIAYNKQLSNGNEFCFSFIFMLKKCWMRGCGYCYVYLIVYFLLWFITTIDPSSQQPLHYYHHQLLMFKCVIRKLILVHCARSHFLGLARYQFQVTAAAMEAVKNIWEYEIGKRWKKKRFGASQGKRMNDYESIMFVSLLLTKKM